MKKRIKKNILIIIGLVVINILFISAEPSFGTPTPFQQTINQLIGLIPINIAGKQIKISFEGNTWRGTLNGADLLAGECKFEETADGTIIHIKQSWLYANSGQINPITKKPIATWVETNGPDLFFEYKKGPPPSILPISQETAEQIAGKPLSIDANTEAAQQNNRGASNKTEKSANVKNNWMSYELAFMGIGIRYERMLSPKGSFGLNVYFNPFPDLATKYFEINTFFRGYPWGKTFFLGAGLGYHHEFIHYEVINGSTISYNVTSSGFTIIPEIGWKIDVGKAGGFYIMPSLSVPLVFGEAGLTSGRRLIYFGMGHAF